MPEAKVTIVILNWNGRDDTLECLKSVFEIDYPDFDVIVVDNGSTDGSVAAIRQAFPQVRLLETGENLGYAGGNNVGIRHALDQGADFIFLLNNDTTVAPDILEHLVAAGIRYPEAGIIGPKIYYHDQPDLIWSAGGYWDRNNQCFEQLGDGEPDRGQFDQPVETEFLVGCALFVRAECFRSIGLLEEEFFLNYEEIDFEWRVKQAGYRLQFCPKARMWHKIAASFGGEASPLKVYFTYRNRLLWASRHLSRKERLRLFASVYRKWANRLLASMRTGRPYLPRELLWTLRSTVNNPITRAMGRAILDYHLGRFGNCPDTIHQLNRRWQTLRAAEAVE